jgi:outer membrane protein
MKRWAFSLLIGLSFFCYLSYATDLMTVYHQALENDTLFKQMYNTYLSTAESIPIAKSILYPQIVISGQGLYTMHHTNGDEVPVKRSYPTYTWQLTASQTVFNHEAWTRVQQARSFVKASQATFNSAAQALILRTSKAYFAILLAQDNVRFTMLKKHANKQQLVQARARANSGLDALTSVFEAQAAFDQSVAQVISAKNKLSNSYENLCKITNHRYQKIASLKSNYTPSIKPNPDNINSWVTAALQQNYQLLASKYRLDAARDAIKIQSAIGRPTMALQSSHTQRYNNNGDTSIFAPAHKAFATVGLAVDFPVFQGGLIQAKTRQAQFDFQAASDLVEQTRRDIIVNTRIAFNTIINGISNVAADKKTINSAHYALKSTTAQFEVSIRTMADVVNAQERLFKAQTQLANDQYALINASLTLKYLAGTLSGGDIADINSWLATNS